MDFLQRLQTLEKTIKENQILKARLDEKKDNLEKEYKKLLSELDNQGIKELDLEQTITNIETELEDEISAIEASLK